MSDYVHSKVIRLPFPAEIMQKCQTSDAYDCEDYLSSLLGDLWKSPREKGFEIEYTNKATYIDWVYYYTYGEDSGDFGSSRMLTQAELDIIKPYFDKLGVNYSHSDLRRVEYCYYNCCECVDYYSTETSDDSHLLI